MKFEILKILKNLEILNFFENVDLFWVYCMGVAK
jgi:hypothetical protein